MPCRRNAQRQAEHGAGEVTERRLRVVQRKGVGAFAALFAPVVKWLESPSAAVVSRSSRNDVIARMEELRRGDWRMQPQKFAVFGDEVVVDVKEVHRRRSRGAERRCGHYWRLSSGFAERLEVHRTQAAAIDSVFGYLPLLERLHEHLRPRTYVEIGVAAGHSLGRARPSTRIVGIDPNPTISDPVVRKSSRIFELTSDEFFDQHDLCSELGGLPVDLAFIDGMHLFEYALRDFINVEAHCHSMPAGASTGSNCRSGGRSPNRAWHHHGARARVERLEASLAEIETRYRSLDWIEETRGNAHLSIDQEWDALEPVLPPTLDC
jgi:hypothetical protein